MQTLLDDMAWEAAEHDLEVGFNKSAFCGASHSGSIISRAPLGARPLWLFCEGKLTTLPAYGWLAGRDSLGIFKILQIYFRIITPRGSERKLV